MRHRIGHASSLVEETDCGADADGGRVPLEKQLGESSCLLAAHAAAAGFL